LFRPEHLYPLYLLLFTLPGIPALYYGSEWGLEGKKEAQSDDQLRPKVTLTCLERFAKNSLLVHSIKRFIAIRKKSKALVNGSYQEVIVAKEHFVFCRKDKSESLLIVINASPKTKTVHIALEDSPKKRYVDLLDPDFSISCINGTLSIEVPKFGGRIVRH
jgi:glycosidase